MNIWRKLQNQPRILKMPHNSPGIITETDPTLSEIAEQSLSRTTQFQPRFALIFDCFEHQFGPKLKPNDKAQIPIDIK